jgi:hypothetical protein
LKLPPTFISRASGAKSARIISCSSNAGETLGNRLSERLRLDHMDQLLRCAEEWTNDNLIGQLGPQPITVCQ